MIFLTTYNLQLNYLFSAAYNPNISASQLKSDLKKNSHWEYKWGMTFNPDLSKQAQDVILSQ